VGDMAQVIVPRSDQINSDDLLGRTMTITITDVKIRGGQEQPISIEFEGSEKVFRPCKSMCRVMAQAWGLDSKQYIGRSMTLYCDPTVKFGPLAVGGIRISHMSHIDGPMVMALTATKGVKKSYKVQPLADVATTPAPAARDKASQWALSQIKAIDGAGDAEALQSVLSAGEKAMAKLKRDFPDLHDQVRIAADAKQKDFGGSSEDPFGLPEVGERITDELIAQAEGQG